MKASPVPLRRMRYCLLSQEGYLADLSEALVTSSTAIMTDDAAQALQYVSFEKAVESALLIRDTVSVKPVAVTFELEGDNKWSPR